MKLHAMLCVTLTAMLPSAMVHAQTLHERVDQLARGMEARVIEWRRDIHQNPELSNREFRTSKLVEEHLRGLGLEVQTGVAHTGVVALLRGGKPGPVIALRADMDALPVVEEVDVPFASKIKTTYDGREVGVMHACGHDAHVSIMMGVAQILVQVRDQIPGTIKFIFQPAEENPPPGEEGGAKMMIKEGVLDNPAPEAIFGLHVFSRLPAGKISYRPGPLMASADIMRIKVQGRQTHGAMPWGGVDPIVVGSQIVLGLQTIISRQTEIVKEPAIVTVGSFHGGNRFNIVPDLVEMTGTIRTFDEPMRNDIHRRVKVTSESIAAASGATATVTIDRVVNVTRNDPSLLQKMLPTLQRVVGEDNLVYQDKTTTGEDFSYFHEKIPALFYFVGVTPPDADMSKVALNHSPRFFIDERGLLVGLRSLAAVAVDYLEAAGK